MRNDVMKVDKHGHHKLQREGKSYALVQIGGERLTGCDSCAFRHAPGINACPEDSVDGKKARLVCDRIEQTRLHRTDRRAVWIQLA